ncbi:MAG: hypothetical protein ABJB74_00360 [Gemmatimonas sp.]
MTPPSETPTLPPTVRRPLAGHEKLLTGGAVVGILVIAASILALPAPGDGGRLPMPVVSVRQVLPAPRVADATVPAPDSTTPARVAPPVALTTPGTTAAPPVPKPTPPVGALPKPSKPTAKTEVKASTAANKRDVQATKAASKTPSTAVPTANEETRTASETRPIRVVSQCEQSFTSHDWPAAFDACSNEAARGTRTAQRHLAVLYLDGHGTKRNEREAVRLFTDAANGGDTESMVQLANALERGRGTPKDEAGALRWYQKAGDSGMAAAQYAVGEAYERGHLGLKKDKLQAIAWYQKAAEHGFGDAARKVRDLSK